MAYEVLKDDDLKDDDLINDDLIDSTEVTDGKPKAKSGSGIDLFNEAVAKNPIDKNFILDKSYALDAVKGKKIMGDAFLPHKSGFKNLYKIAEKNHELHIAKIKSENQGIAGEIGGAIAQAAAEIVGGTVEGLGYLADFQSMTDGTFGEGNWFSALGTGLKDWVREVAPVHVNPEVQGKFAPWSSEWWFSNIPSVASAVSIMIPVAGWARGVGMIGKGVGLAAKGIKGLNYTALRYFNVAGPLQDYERTIPPVFAGFILRIKGGRNPIVFGDYMKARDYIDVSDVNAFHILCMENEDTANQTFNLGTGKMTNLMDLKNLIADIMDVKVEFDHYDAIAGEALNSYGDISKAKSMGWEPKKDITDTIKETIVYLENEIEEGNIDPFTFMEDLEIEKVKI